MNMETNERTWKLPHDDEMEKIVIGTLMQQSEAIGRTRDILTPECFYNSFNRRLFSAICAIDKRGDEPDIMTVHRQLRDTNEDIKLEDLLEFVNKRTFVYEQNALALKELAAMRRAFHIGYDLMKCASTGERGGYTLIEETTEQLKDLYRDERDTVVSLDDTLKKVDECIKLNLSTERMTGSPTGFVEFDKRGGLQPGWLVVIGADTSAGKTSLASCISLQSAYYGTGIAFYSMEMEAHEISARLAAIVGNVSSSKLLYRKLNQAELSYFDVAAGKLQGLPIYYDDRSTSGIDNILRSIRYMKIKHGIGGAVVDYLQILSVSSSHSSGREQQLAEAARKLKNAAKELGIWIIVLSQLNRDKNDPQPSITRLRDSAQIADAADVVMLLYRPELYGKKHPDNFSNVNPKGTAYIDVAKGRSIGTFQFVVGFDKELTRFYDLQDLPRMDTEEDPF